MKLAGKYGAIAAFLLIFISCNNPDDSREIDGPKKIFHLVDPAQSGINFTNRVSDGDKFNILTYRNFYNGGGVAIGDINNDGLADVYFTANQEKNRLYLNKGNLKFEDITSKAGVAGTMSWSTGVTMADVNGDGLLDIYVCNSGDVDGNSKKNELFINNGNLTFTEKARDYNLDNEGYSTHAAFFDYDVDGDLDCYILNNSFRDPAKIELYRKVREEISPGGHKLMRNDGNTFTDVTREAGIYSSEIAFGLGVAVSDLNGDLLPDLYISNDFWERDYLYINKGNGTFSEELTSRINYCSTSSMGADIADINNDGSPEIFTTDMLPGDNYRLKTTMAFDPYHLEDLKYRANYHYQITQNCLHLNDGRANFAEIGLLSGVAATDWSWGALIFDFENDGNKDIFVSNGILKDIMSMDFLEFIGNQVNVHRTSGKDQFDYKKFISNIPTQPLKNYAFTNGGDLRFSNSADALGLTDSSYSNGAAYGDLDNDGDLDLVVNNINTTAFVHRNDANTSADNQYLKLKFKGPSKNPFGIGAIVTIKTKNGIQVLQNYNTRGFQSSIEPSLVFGLGGSPVDTLTVTWPDSRIQKLVSVKGNQQLTLQYADATERTQPPSTSSTPLFSKRSEPAIPEAVHRENRYNDFDDEILLVRMLSTEGPRLVTGDANKDGLSDFILPGAAGDADKLFLQVQPGKYQFKSNPAFLNDRAFETTCGTFLDYDGDGDADLMLGAGGNQPGMPRENFVVRCYLNDGEGNFSPHPQGMPRVIGNFSTIKAADIDGDGDEDLFLGARNVPGNYGLPPRSYLLTNDRGVWNDISTPTLASVGLVTDAAWSDVDKDNDKDLIVIGDWMAITVFRNDGGLFDNKTVVPGSNGWWNRIEMADLDKDGDDDFVLGNWGLNTKFSATPQRPMTMYVNDFDKNGKSEFIINWFPPLDTVAYPFATKPELTAQLPGLRKQILRYEDYGNKTYEMLFPPDVRNTALRYDADNLQTSVLWNNDGKFELAPLPVEAQITPVFGIVADDLDDDGVSDIWLGGNFYALKPQAGRHNASTGVFLKGRGNRQFTFVPTSRSGIMVEGEVREAEVISAGGKKHILVARNNAPVVVFEK